MQKIHLLEEDHVKQLAEGNTDLWRKKWQKFSKCTIFSCLNSVVKKRGE